jgi:ketosteroid isomerase-like protein
MDQSRDGDVAGVVRRAEDAADAWVRGDVDRYVALTPHAPGFTLLAPTGGPVTEHEARGEELRTWVSDFRNGEARLEHVATHAWGDTVVLVMIERQHGELGDLPDQNLSLRVTHVYRHDGDDWLLVHRHADPLVRPLPLPDVAALLARS